MAVYLCPISSVFQWFTDQGIVLSGGKINTYLAGSSTPQTTYTDSTGITPNQNPIVLGASGRLTNVQIWQPQGVLLKIVVTDANNNQLGPVFDQVGGINDPTIVLSSLSTATSGSGADLVANSVRSFDLISSLRSSGAPSLVSGQTKVVDVQAGQTPGDGYSGLFYWDATNSSTDDSVNIIKPTGVVGNGRYVRQRANTFFSYKVADTIRSNTSTLTIDPDLQINLPAGFIGVYSFDALLSFQAPVSGAGGIKISIVTTDLGLQFNPPFIYYGLISGSNQSGTLSWLTAPGAGQILSATVALATNVVYINGVIAGGSNGRYSIYWSQNSSNSNALVMNAGSFIRATLKVP